jgi:hypothetical protein
MPVGGRHFPGKHDRRGGHVREGRRCDWRRRQYCSSLLLSLTLSHSVLLLIHLHSKSDWRAGEAVGHTQGNTPDAGERWA